MRYTRHGGVVCRLPAVGLERSFQVGHQRVAVDDAGGFALQDSRLGAHVRFPPRHFLAGQEARRNANGLGEGVYFLQLPHLLVVLGHDPLLAVSVRDVLRGAEGVHHLLALYAELGFERIMSVVEPRVDDFWVARWGLRAGGGVFFDEQGGAGGVGGGQAAGYGEADCTGADYLGREVRGVRIGG